MHIYTYIHICTCIKVIIKFVEWFRWMQTSIGIFLACPTLKIHAGLFVCFHRNHFRKCMIKHIHHFFKCKLCPHTYLHIPCTVEHVYECREREHMGTRLDVPPGLTQDPAFEHRDDGATRYDTVHTIIINHIMCSRKRTLTRVFTVASAT